MRWVFFVILVWLVVLVQASIGKVLTISDTPIGVVGPDLAALVAVFVALHVRDGADAMLAGWVLGLGLDLAAGSGTGAPGAVGPMPVAYALATGALYRLREAFFVERAVTQALLALGFCLLAHGIWVTWQTALAARTMAWADYGRLLLQAAALATYTAVLMPLGHCGLRRGQRWILATPPGRAGRR